ncbi:MAG: radical SAM protein [bacterium]
MNNMVSSQSRVSIYNNLLNISPDRHSHYSFDASGRLFAIHADNWFIRRGLNGKMSARKLIDGAHAVRIYSVDESMVIEEAAYTAVQELSETDTRLIEVKMQGAYNRAQLNSWIYRAVHFNLKEDLLAYHRVYNSAVGILPPDQYLPVVVQITEGCDWNKCSFCRFYKDTIFKKKSMKEIAVHIAEIKKYFGLGISVRNSVFLGEANGISFNRGNMIDIVRLVKKDLGACMPDFRGVSAFMESSGDAQTLTQPDFKALAQEGLSYLYVGLETGNDALRQLLKKPGSITSVVQAVEKAKGGGISIGLILMSGIGGHEYAQQHIEDSMRVIRDMNLDSSDMIFLSPYVENNTNRVGYKSLTSDEIIDQARCIQKALPPGIRSSLYEVQAFVY